MRVLVVVPCTKGKIWDDGQHSGPIAARDAYTGPSFRANRRYASRVADRWVVLSARYGFISPEWQIPGPYDVTFNRPDDPYVSVERLREQAAAMGLDGYDVVVALGTRPYRERVIAAFGPERVRSGKIDPDVLNLSCDHGSDTELQLAPVETGAARS